MVLGLGGVGGGLRVLQRLKNYEMVVGSKPAILAEG